MAKLGLQLYTVRDEAAKDFLGTIRRVGKLGYDGIEFAGGIRAAASLSDLQYTIRDAGLLVAGAVFSWKEFEEDIPGVIAFSKAIGSPAVVLPATPVHLRSLEGFRRLAQASNLWGRACASHGLRFLYHVHGHEFVDAGGRLAMDLMMEIFDPAAVWLEPDVYWIEHAGADSIDFLKKWGNRSPYIHFKDMLDRESKKDVEVGGGAIDMQAVARIGYANRADWFIVEQEQFDMPSIESAEISLRNMRRIMQETRTSGA